MKLGVVALVACFALSFAQQENYLEWVTNYVNLERQISGLEGAVRGVTSADGRNLYATSYAVRRGQDIILLCEGVS